MRMIPLVFVMALFSCGCSAGERLPPAPQTFRFEVVDADGKPVEFATIGVTSPAPLLALSPGSEALEDIPDREARRIPPEWYPTIWKRDPRRWELWTDFINSGGGISYFGMTGEDGRQEFVFDHSEFVKKVGCRDDFVFVVLAGAWGRGFGTQDIDIDCSKPGYDVRVTLARRPGGDLKPSPLRRELMAIRFDLTCAHCNERMTTANWERLQGLGGRLRRLIERAGQAGENEVAAEALYWLARGPSFLMAEGPVNGYSQSGQIGPAEQRTLERALLLDSGLTVADEELVRTFRAWRPVIADDYKYGAQYARDLKNNEKRLALYRNTATRYLAVVARHPTTVESWFLAAAGEELWGASCEAEALNLIHEAKRVDPLLPKRFLENASAFAPEEIPCQVPVPIQYGPEGQVLRTDEDTK